jgi:hypothetical protein
MVLSDVLRCVLYNIVCPCRVWPWYCLTFFDECYTKHIEERQTIPWPKPTRTNIVMQNTTENARQYNGQNQQGQTMLYKTVWFWPWYCLTFFDVFCITLFVLVGFGHGIVWRSSMCFVLHCLSLLVLSMELSDVLRYALHNIVCPWSTSKNVRQYHGQNQQGQTMLYKTHRRTSDNTMAKTNKDKQWYTKHIEERQTIPWPKPTRTNNVCLTFFDVLCIKLFVLVGFSHGIFWRSSMCFV